MREKLEKRSAREEEFNLRGNKGEKEEKTRNEKSFCSKIRMGERNRNNAKGRERKRSKGR
jgi:hypothetical protein